MIVMKFGGTSVGSQEAFAQVATIVGKRVAEENGSDSALPGVVVVTSAMSGVTNILIDSAKQAAQGDVHAYEAAYDVLVKKHQAVLNELVTDTAEQAQVHQVLDTRLQEFGRLCSSIAVLGELTPRGLDVVSGLGERMSAPLLAAVLRGQGISAKFVDAAELIVTDNVHGCREQLLPMIEAGIVPVITGFVAATQDGTPTTLGRGGSDYSAAIFGASLDADEIQILTDVNGVLTADPRIVPDARSLNRLSYEEVAELAYYGAKVLHPKTVKPAIEKQIPLRVLNTFEPEQPGTQIVPATEMADEVSDESASGSVKAVTAIRNMTLITIAGRGMMGVPGIAARAFGSVARVAANVLMISQSSSEQSLCFVIPDGPAQIVAQELHTEFERELERGYIDRVESYPDAVIVAVVGSGMRGIPGLAAGIFGAIGQRAINIVAIAQGSSEANISFVVDDADAADAVRAIHQAFELDKPTEARIKKS